MAIKMTRAEYEAKYGVQPPVSGTQNKSVVQNQTTPIKMTRAEYEAKYGKQNLQAQGLPVSVRKDRTQPTLVGGIIRDIVKQPIKAALTIARPFVDPIGKKSGLSVNTKYLGNVGDYGTEIEKSTNNLANKYKAGEISLGRAALGGAGAGALQAMDFAAVAPVGKVASQAIRGTVKQSLVPTLKAAAKESLIRGGAVGAGYDVSSQLASGEKYNPLQTVAAGTVGTVADFGLSYGLPKALNNGKDIIVKTPEQRSIGVDKDIRNIFKGTTGDVQKINDSAFRARKGLELLQKESKNISIPDESAPLGSNITKKFDITKAKPNELLSAVKEQDNLITSRARKAVENARSQGLSIDTNEAVGIINQAEQSGQVTKAMAERIRNQIADIGNDPVKAHDWVQEVNTRFKKKYERGTIDDTVLGKLADDVADTIRTNLDNVIDRKGYAEAFGNNQELKRMLVAIAKKANRSVNFGDITTDAGLDLGIALLTGNPAYMARTIGSGLFRGVVSKFRNNAGLRSFRSAVKGTAKVGTETRLPYSVAKPQFKSKNLLPEGKGFENKAGIQLGKPKTPTTFEPRAKVVNTQPRAKQPALPAPKNVELPKNITKTTLGSDVAENAVMRNKIETPKKSITKPVVKTEPKTLPKAISTLEQEAKKYKSADELFNAIKEALKRNSYNQEELFPDRIGYKSTMNAEQMLKNSKDNLDRARNKTVREGGTGRPTREYEQSLKFWEKSVKEKQDILNKLEENNRIYESTKDKYTNSVALEKLKELKRISEDDYRLIKTFLDYQLENGAFTKMSQLEELLNKANKPKRIISEESYKKALKNLGDTSTLNSTPIHLSKDALIVAGYHIENGVRSAAELGIELAKKGYKFTKEQLEELFNKANKNVEIEPLIQEAKKYKSAEEFVKAHETTGNVGTSFSRSTIFEKYPDIYQKNRMNIKPNAADKYDFHLSPLTNENFKLSNFENAEGFYKKPKIMKDLDGNTFAYLTKPFEKLGKQEKWNLRKVYDSTSKSEKPVFITEDGGKTFFTAENEVIGTGKTKSQLTDIWNKANKKVAVELPTGLVQQAKKYKSAEEFVKDNKVTEKIVKDYSEKYDLPMLSKNLDAVGNNKINENLTFYKSNTKLNFTDNHFPNEKNIIAHTRSYDDWKWNEGATKKIPNKRYIVEIQSPAFGNSYNSSVLPQDIAKNKKTWIEGVLSTEFKKAKEAGIETLYTPTGETAVTIQKSHVDPFLGRVSNESLMPKEVAKQKNKPVYNFYEDIGKMSDGLYTDKKGVTWYKFDLWNKANKK